MYEKIKEKYSEIEKELSDSNVISDLKKYQEISKKHSELKNAIDLILKLEKNTTTIKSNQEILEKENDQEMIEMASNENEKLTEENEKLTEEIEEIINPSDPNNKKNAILEIRAGTGGDESALFTADLFRMYSRYAEKMGWKIEIIDSNQIGLGGFKEIIFSVQGDGVYGKLKYEGGTHRVQRVPETEKAGRIHTSAVTVAVFPEAEEVDIEIKPTDIRIDTFCSSGPGGQSVNTTYSAIRIIHIPTGLIVSCQDQKSQHQNKEKALKVLRSRLLSRAEEEKRNKEGLERKKMIGSGDRSEKIRTYNFPQDRITDHRLKKNWHSIDLIMDGGLDDLIYSLQKESKNNHVD
jgi:peptide chain release factor 1